MRNLLRKYFFGDTVITEYSTVTVPDGIRERVYLKDRQKVIDISTTHWLLCLDPIVIGFWVAQTGGDGITLSNEGTRIYFTDRACADAEDPALHAVALLEMVYFNKITEASGSLFLLKLKKSKIYHVSLLKTYLLYFKYYKKPNLSFEKLKSFAAAYSYPRKVRLISFRQDDYYNIFPMDLLGEIPQGRYFVFGLRHTNRSLDKIIRTGKMLVSELSFEHKKIIYALGSHHSTDPPAVESLPFGIIQSKEFGFYVPQWVESYKEVHIQKTVNLGSHMLLWGQWGQEQRLGHSSGYLYHIHFLLYLHEQRLGWPYPLV